MNTKKINFLFFISFFPVFIFRSNLQFNYIIITLLFFFLLFVINFLFFFKKKKLTNNFLLNFYFALLFTIGLDNNLGLFNGVIQPFRFDLMEIFGVIYTSAALLFLLILIIIFSAMNFTKSPKKISTIFIIFLFAIFIFNIFDKTKSEENIINFIKNNKLNYERTTLVMIWDEMTGINSIESQTLEGEKFVNSANNFFMKYKFKVFPNSYSVSSNSIGSITNLVNFKTEIDEKNYMKLVKLSKDYFVEYEMLQNKFFDNFESISVFQNMHINYCKHNNVKKCNQYNPFKQKIFLEGYKNNYLTKILSIWTINGSITAKFIWRVAKQLRLTDSSLEPEGEKASIKNRLEHVKDDLLSKKYELVFFHALVPHKPYGFNKNCSYNGTLSNLNIYFSNSKHILHHNIERKCVIEFLEIFLSELYEEKILDNIDIFILSDHGSRISSDKESSLSNIFAVKKGNSKYVNSLETKSLQALFVENLK